MGGCQSWTQLQNRAGKNHERKSFQRLLPTETLTLAQEVPWVPRGGEEGLGWCCDGFTLSSLPSHGICCW